MGRPRQGFSIRAPKTPRAARTVRFTDEAGRPRELSTGTRDPVEAQIRGAEIYKREKDAPVVARPRIDAFLGLDEMIALYLSDMETSLDEETIETYTGYGKRFVSFFENALENIRPSRMGIYQRQRLGRVLRKSVRKERSMLNGFLDWLVEQEVLTEDTKPAWPKMPKRAPGVRSGPQRSHPVDVSPDEVRRFVLALPLMSRRHLGRPFVIRARFIFMYETGLRPALVSALRTPDHWRPGETELRYDAKLDKARKDRKKPLSPLAIAALEATIAATGVTDGPIFGEHDCRAAVEAARIVACLPKGFAPYDLRHARAGHTLDATGGDVRAVQYLLDHAEMTTTNRYIRGDEKRARAAVGFGGQAGNEELAMLSAKEGSRTLTGVTPLEPESSGVAHNSAIAGESSGQDGTGSADIGTTDHGFRGFPETPIPNSDPVVRAAKHLAALRAVDAVHEEILADDILDDLRRKRAP